MRLFLERTLVTVDKQKTITENLNNDKPYVHITLFYCCEFKNFGFILRR